MQLVEVRTPAHSREFLEFPVRLYRHEPHWIRPLDKDLEEVFDPKANKYFGRGEAIRWLLLDEKGKTLGRVAAFINRETSDLEKQPTGGMGFFDCINDQAAANALFDACKNWLQERGMAAMDGPINFGDRDRWWGLLVDGFIAPNYGMFYHFPYYQTLFESYGFKDYFRQLTFCRKVMDPLSPKLHEKAERVARRKDYSFRHMRKSELEKYAEEFRIIYNQAWTKHGVGEISKEQALKLMKKLKPVIDEKIVWFGYYKDEPVAFFIMLPELNQLFRHVNGKLDLIGKLKVVWHQWRKTVNKMFGLVFGIVPAHQGRGLEGALIMAARQMVQEDDQRYEDFEMNWVGDFNPRMIHVAEEVGGYIGKTHITYRKLFDESQSFERHPVIV